MTAFLVDSNVLLDVLTEDPRWSTWSSAALSQAADKGTLHINPVIYAEVSIRFETIEELDEVLAPDMFIRTELPWDAGFLAGKCFLKYRRSGGMRSSPLPEFYIGAHAAVSGLTLVTRDATRYRTCFPRLALIFPPA